MLRPNVFVSLLRHSWYSSSQGCVPPSDARSSLTKPVWSAPHRQTASEAVSARLSLQTHSNTGHYGHHKCRPRHTTSPAPRSDPQCARFSSPSSYPLSPTDTLVDVACHYCVHPPYLPLPSVVNTTFGPSTNCCHFSEYLASWT
jgi:hypothetical protein